MKKNIISGFIILATALALQSCNDTKVVEKKVWVRGNCEMCKERIEEHVQKINGVKSAIWDVNSKILTVKYDSTLANQNAVETICANVGHATKAKISEGKVIDELPECCKPRK
jgi:copper chaperone CopZ